MKYALTIAITALVTSIIWASALVYMFQATSIREFIQKYRYDWKESKVSQSFCKEWQLIPYTELNHQLVGVGSCWACLSVIDCFGSNVECHRHKLKLVRLCGVVDRFGSNIEYH